METLSQKDVQVLLDGPNGEGMVVSCYADTSVAQGFEPHWVGHFKSEVSRVRQALVGDEVARHEFERNLQAVREAFETPEAHRARGLAVFSSAARGLFRCFTLDVPVAHRLVVDEEMYLVPLIEALESGHECLVVLTDSHRGRLYAATPNRSRLVAEIEEVVPKKRRASGQRRGKEQGNAIERHRQDAIRHFLTGLAHEVEKAWNAAAFRGIVLLGPRETVSQFRNQLPAQLVNQVFHEGPQTWNGKPAETSGVVRSAITEATLARRQRVLEEITHRIADGYAVTAGSQEVLDALRNGRASCLVLGPDPGQIASRCTGCGWSFATVQETCSFCLARCEKTNLWQQILTLALRHAVAVEFVGANAALARHGGVAARLSREAP